MSQYVGKQNFYVTTKYRQPTGMVTLLTSQLMLWLETIALSVWFTVLKHRTYYLPHIRKPPHNRWLYPTEVRSSVGISCTRQRENTL